METNFGSSCTVYVAMSKVHFSANSLIVDYYYESAGTHIIAMVEAIIGNINGSVAKFSKKLNTPFPLFNYAANE